MEKLRGNPPRKEVDVKILALRATGTRVSMRKTAELLQEPVMTVSDHLHALGGEYKPIRRNPHTLTTTQKKNRVGMARDLFHLLRDKKKWPRIVTGDETWIYLNNFGKAEWLLPGEEPTIGAKKQVGDKKLLLTVFFSTSGVHLAEFQPEGEAVTAQVMCNTFGSIASTLRTDHLHPAWVHMDNARPHVAKLTQLRLKDLHLCAIKHQPYSPDLSPCDFYLFGYLKGIIGGRIFRDFDEMKRCVIEELHKIPQKTLRSVYNSWIRCLEECTRNGGEYVHEY